MTRKLIALFLCMSILAGGAALAETEQIVLTDMTGRQIELDGPADRVVVLSAADCEILYALGAGDMLVGRGAYCNYPAEIADVPEVQSGYETNIEEIIALEPQVVILSKMAQTIEQEDQLENAGIRVVVMDAQTVDDVYEAIALIGAIVNRNDEAAALIAEMQASFADIAENAAQNEGKTVYIEVSPLEWGLWAAGSDSFLDEIASMCGLTNVFADLSGWAEVSEEQVIARDPDYIVTVTGNGTEEIAARAGWNDIQAVANGCLYAPEDLDSLTRPGPRLAEAAQALSDFMAGQ